MAKLTTEERNKLPDRAFAYIDRAGERHLPMHDADHARNAIARYPQTEFESKAARERVRKRILEPPMSSGSRWPTTMRYVKKLIEGRK